MIEKGQLFEDVAASKFEHDRLLQEYTRHFFDTPVWMRDKYAEQGVRAESQAWFKKLTDFQKDMLRACTVDVVARYRGCGQLFSPTYGAYFLHAGGALTLLSAPVLKGCPCGSEHYKPT